MSRILQVGKFYPIVGGVEKVMYDLTCGLSARGIDCDMLCATAGDSQVVELNDHGRVICLHAWRKVAATMICPAMAFWLRKHRREYDIVHIHHPDPMACMALWFSGFRGKVVLHWHSDIIKQRTLLRFYKPFQSWLIRRADLMLGTTPVYVQESPWLQSVQDKVAFLPIGIEPVDDAFTPPSLEHDKIVFSLGRLVEYKGYRYLVEAARYLPDDYRVVIGGSGPLRDELLAQIDSLGLQDKVTLLGRVPDDELAGWYKRCAVFCMSSCMKTEAFGIVQIEAMASSRPVVATKIPESGVSWVNSDGVSGLNVPVADPQAIASAILSITSDPLVYERYCRGAYEHYLNSFTIDRMVDGCIRYYQGL